MEVFTMNKHNGSLIAKQGFKNEIDVAEKFNSWKNNKEIHECLSIMGYDLDEIENVNARIIRTNKTDVQVEVIRKSSKKIERHNIQIKLVSNKKGFNQVDKRWTDTYQKMWNIPEDITTLLKYYAGELKPYVNNSRDSRRMFLNEFSLKQQEDIVDFFSENKIWILCDVLKGRKSFCAEWILVVQRVDYEKWILAPINKIINYYSKGDVEITSKGSLKIGQVTMQRKGGDCGRPSANMLQFKMNPAKIFEL